MSPAAASKNAEFLQAQNRVFELMARGASLQQILTALIEVIQAQCPGMLGSVLLLDRDGIHVRHGAAPDLPDDFSRQVDGEPIGPKAGSCGTAAFRRQPVIVEDIESDPLWDDYRALALRHRLRACWSTPILDPHGLVLGTFAMYFRNPGRPDPQHLRLIETSTHIASIAISKHRAEEDAKRRDALLNEAQHIANLGSYEWDLRTNQVYRSAELYRIFGLQPHEFEPTYEGYLCRVHPEDRSKTKDIIDTAFREGQPFDFEERIVWPDGAVRLLHSQGRWTPDDSGRPIKLIGTCQDITDRKKVEQQLRLANTALAKELEERTRAEAEIRALSARLINAQEEERTRLARELHDDFSQQIAALSIAATNLKKEINPIDSNARAQGERIQQKLIHLATGVRRLSHSLHPAVLEYSGLSAALRSYCAEVSTLTGMKVVFSTEGICEGLAPSIALNVYRVAQEALQNVLKHARTDTAELDLTLSDNSVKLTVSDRGTGMDAGASESPGLGLVNMKERARLVNGLMDIASAPHQGTKLTLVVPIPR